MKTKNSTLDSLIQSVSAQHGGICTFGDCLGGHLTIGSDGGVYLCQRYAEMPEYQFGNVLDNPSMETLSGNRLWHMFADRQSRITEECGACEHLDHCRGGCPYNTLAANGGSFDKTMRDPHCPAYKKIFGKIVDQAVDETFSGENMAAVVQEPNGKAGLLREGKLLGLMNREPHPYDVSQNAKRLVAAVALAATGSPKEATRKMADLGLVKAPEESEKVLTAMHRQLTAHTTGFNNLYLHITFVCNLQCEHCYSQSGPTQNGFMAVDKILRACYETAGFGFKHVVITGGEPLVHPKRNELLDGLAELRPQIKPALTVLRTSLALKLSSELLRRIGHSTDEVVVSVDGNRETHDRQRGVGAYDLTVRNLRALGEMGYDTDLSLATMLPNEQMQGAPGNSVRQLAAELGIERIRFKPLLPIGRAQTSDLNIIPETQWGHQDPWTVLANGFRPGASCGMGQNLYVEPDGGAYPCYACQGQKWRIGNITADGGLRSVLTSAAFTQLGAHTVNSNRKCQMCAVRYLCGGACRAWNPMDEADDLDTPPADCSHLHERARSLLDSALYELEISFMKWRSTGLPLPEEPPKIWEYEAYCTKS